MFPVIHDEALRVVEFDWIMINSAFADQAMPVKPSE
jgi:hypothetical protein